MTGVSHLSGFTYHHLKLSHSMMTSSYLVYPITRKWLPQFKMPHADVTKPKGRRGLPQPVFFYKQGYLSQKTQTYVSYVSLARIEFYANHSPVSELFTMSFDQPSIMCGLQTPGCPQTPFSVLAKSKRDQNNTFVLFAFFALLRCPLIVQRQ